MIFARFFFIAFLSIGVKRIFEIKLLYNKKFQSGELKKNHWSSFKANASWISMMWQTYLNYWAWGGKKKAIYCYENHLMQFPSTTGVFQSQHCLPSQGLGMALHMASLYHLRLGYPFSINYFNIWVHSKAAKTFWPEKQELYLWQTEFKEFFVLVLLMKESKYWFIKILTLERFSKSVHATKTTCVK